MADSYTPNAALVKPAFNDAGWDALLNGNAAALDALAPLGGLCVTTAERPTSTSLHVAVSAGSLLNVAGAIVSVAAVPTLAVTASMTNYVHVTAGGAVAANTTGFPAGSCPLATVVAGASTVTSIADARVTLRATGAQTGAVFGASGGSHSAGAVPDPGPTAGTTRVLFETGTWANPPGANGAPVFNVKAYGALGDGATDDTAAILAAWNASYAGTSPPRNSVYFPAGNYVYNGTGLVPSDSSFQVHGDGKIRSSVLLGASSRLVDTAASSTWISFRDITTIGGLGAFRSTFTGINSSVAAVEFSRCLFWQYTECAVNMNSSDWAYIRFLECEFAGSAAQSSIGLAVGGLSDGMRIAGCVFNQNRVGLKFRNGVNAVVEATNFLRAGTIGAHPRIDLWVVPHSTQVNGGDNFTVRDCKFGNEYLDPADYRILFADEDTGAGSDNGTYFPKLTADSAGYIVGHRYSGNGVYGAGATAQPWVYSTTPNVFACSFGPTFFSGTQPSHLVKFRSAPTPSAGLPLNVFGPVTSDALAIYSPTCPVSNYPGVGRLLDPAELLVTDAGQPLESAGAGDPVGYVPLCYTPAQSYLPGGSIAAAADYYGGPDAATATIAPSSAVYAPFGGLGSLVAGRPAWVEIDLKQAAASPLSSVTLYLVEDSFAATHFQRVLNVPATWQPFRFAWTPIDVPASLNVFLYNQGAASGQVTFGRVRVYHAREPLNVDGRLLAVRPAAGPIVPAAATPAVGSGACAIDWATGNVFSVVLNEPTTSITFLRAAVGQTITLRLVQDGTGGRAVNLPTILWPGGSSYAAAPPTTTAGAIDRVAVTCTGAGAYEGEFKLNFH